MTKDESVFERFTEVIMKSWAKFFFGSFFSNKIANGGEERGILNTLLGILLALIIIWAGFLAGAAASLPVMYDSSSAYHEFLYNVFNNDSGKNLYLKTVDGAIFSGVNGQVTDGVINTFLSEDDAKVYAKNGYNLLVDVRNSSTNYNDFFITCEHGDGHKIEYSEYRLLSAEEKKNYKTVLRYGDNSLTFTDELIQSYCDFLGTTKDDTLDAYNKLLVDGNVPADKYNELYELYYTAYYTDYIDVDSFGVAPTMRTYYMYEYMVTKEDGNICKDFLIILDDIYLAVWDTDNGVTMPVSGYYNIDAELNAPDSEQIRTFFVDMFAANSVTLALNYLANMLTPTIVVIACWIVTSLILFFIGRICKRYEFSATVGGLMSIIGSFVLVSSLPAFLLTFICSFFAAQRACYIVAIVSFVVTFIIRSVIYTVYAFKSEPAYVADDEESAES